MYGYGEEIAEQGGMREERGRERDRERETLECIHTS